MAGIPVSEEQKAFFDITNHRIVHTPDYLLAQNAFLKNKVASLQVLYCYLQHLEAGVLFLSNLSERLSYTFAVKRIYRILSAIS